MVESSKNAKRVLISYHSSDNAGVTGRIYDRLIQRVGSDAIFSVKRIYITATVLFALTWTACGSADQTSQQNGGAAGDDSAIGRAFTNKTSNVQVAGEGVVTRILADDVTGSAHQRFLVRLKSGQTLLIAHNVDIAPRVIGLREGDSVSFYGEYVWNEEGGKIHWTHHDPQGRHATGWVKHNGQTFQ